MSTLSRYLLREFFKPLVFTILVFIGLYIISQLVDEMRTFVNHHPPLSLIILYYFYRIPYFLVQILPLACLLASLFALGQLARNNELIAMRSCGIGFYRVAFPILAAALLMVGMVMVFNEVVIPYTNPRAHHIKRVNIEHKADQSFRSRRDGVTRSASGRRILHIKHLDAWAGHMLGVILLELGPGQTIKRRLDAPRGRWCEGQWIFENGVMRRFNSKGMVTEFNKFESLSLPFKEAPRDFIREEKDSDQLLAMTLKELRYRINLLKETGSDPRKEEVNFHLKLSFPFANFILTLLGVSLPFIFPTGKRAMIWVAIGFVLTLLTGFFYIGFIAVGSSFGKNGTLPPLLSVWIANIIFGFLGVYLMRKAQR